MKKKTNVLFVLFQVPHAAAAEEQLEVQPEKRKEEKHEARQKRREERSKKRLEVSLLHHPHFMTYNYINIITINIILKAA